MHAHGRAARGFTLIEQMLCLAALAILLGCAIPSFQGLLRHEHARTATDAMAMALRTARNAAIEHQRRALLCPSLDGRTCSGGTDWQHGWIIALDRYSDGAPGRRILATHGPWHGLRILGSRNRRRIYFHPNGSAAGSNASMAICPRRQRAAGKGTWIVVVSNTGRIRVQRGRAARCR